MRRLALPLALALGLLGVGCGSSDGSSSASAGTVVRLTAENFAYAPGSLRLAAGEDATITVRNGDGTEHNLTVKGLQVDQDLKPGRTTTVEVTAPKAGTYAFFCEYHPQTMKGTITVG